MCRVAIAFQTFGHAGQYVGHCAGDFGVGAAGVQRHGVGPDLVQASAYFLVAQVLQLDLVAAWIGVGNVVAARAAELGKQLDDLAHVDHHDDGRSAFGGGQGAGVVLRLGVGAQQGVAVAFGVAASVDFFGFEDEVAAFVAVHVPV